MGLGGFNLPPIFKVPIIFIYEFLFLGFFYFFLHFIFLIFLSLFRRTSFFHSPTFIFFSISQSYIFLFLSNSFEVPTYFLMYFVQSYSFPSNIRNKKNTIYEWFPSNSASLDKTQVPLFSSSIINFLSSYMIYNFLFLLSSK